MAAGRRQRSTIVVSFLAMAAVVAATWGSGFCEEKAKPDTPGHDYHIGPEDVLDVRVFGEPELMQILRVSPDGTIKFPLIGKVKAAGMTPDQLADTITDALKQGYLKNPQVTVFMQQYRQRMVHVFGEVSAPGPYRLTHNDTFMEIISKAGGFTPVAKREKVKIIRKQKGDQDILYIDAQKIFKEGRLDLDIQLHPGDIIIVPERFF